MEIIRQQLTIEAVTAKTLRNVDFSQCEALSLEQVNVLFDGRRGILDRFASEDRNLRTASSIGLTLELKALVALRAKN